MLIDPNFMFFYRTTSTLHVPYRPQTLEAFEWWPLVVSTYANTTYINSDWLNLTTWKDVFKSITTTLSDDISFDSSIDHSWYVTHNNQSVHSSEGDLHNKDIYSYINQPYTDSCLHRRNFTPIDIIADDCRHYREEALHPFVTQLYYLDYRNETEELQYCSDVQLDDIDTGGDTDTRSLIGNRHRPEDRCIGDYDVTLVTLCTLDRVEKLFKLVHYWGEGPIIAIIYGNQTEVDLITDALKQSTVVQHHHNIVVHLVFRNGVSLTGSNYETVNK